MTAAAGLPARRGRGIAMTGDAWLRYTETPVTPHNLPPSVIARPVRRLAVAIRNPRPSSLFAGMARSSSPGRMACMSASGQARRFSRLLLSEMQTLHWFAFRLGETSAAMFADFDKTSSPNRTRCAGLRFGILFPRPPSPGGRIQWGEPAVPPMAVRRGPGNLYGMVPRRFLSPISFPPKEMGSPAGETPPSCPRPARRRSFS